MFCGDSGWFRGKMVSNSSPNLEICALNFLVAHPNWEVFFRCLELIYICCEFGRRKLELQPNPAQQIGS
jgi:hypothetical protein